MNEVDLEWDNIKAAFETFADSNESEALVRHIVAIAPFADTRRLPEPFLHVENVLANDVHLSPRLRMWALYLQVLGRLGPLGDGVPSEAKRHWRYEQLTEAIGLARDAGEIVLEIHARSMLIWTIDDEDSSTRTAAQASAQEALDLALSTGNDYLIGFALICLGIAQRDDDRHANDSPSLENLRAAAEHFRRAGCIWGLSRTLHWIALNGWDDVDDLVAARPLLKETVELAEQIGDVIMLLFGSANLGFADFAQGDLDQAEYHLRRSLMLSRRLGLPPWQKTFTVATMSFCATARGDYLRAARLTGAFEDLNLEVPTGAGFAWTPLEQRAREESAATLVLALGQETFDREVTTGRNYTFEDVVNLALNRVGASE
jgi:hypothetical protein